MFQKWENIENIATPVKSNTEKIEHVLSIEIGFRLQNADVNQNNNFCLQNKRDTKNTFKDKILWVNVDSGYMYRYMINDNMFSVI